MLENGNLRYRNHDETCGTFGVRYAIFEQRALVSCGKYDYNVVATITASQSSAEASSEKMTLKLSSFGGASNC